MISIAILVLLRTIFFIDRKLFRSNLVANDLSAIIFIQSFSIIKRGFEILSHIAYIRYKRIEFNCYVSIFIVDFDTHVCHCWFIPELHPTLIRLCVYISINWLLNIWPPNNNFHSTETALLSHWTFQFFFPIFWNFRCTKKPLSHLRRLDFISPIHS